MTCDNDYDSLTPKVKFNGLAEAVIVMVSAHSQLFGFMRFDVDFKIFLWPLVRHQFVGR